MTTFNRRQFLTLLAATVLAACGAKTNKYSALPVGSVVVALGDSLTAGYGADDQADYPAVLAALTGWQVINEGISGDVSAGVLARVEKVIEQHQPQLLLLGIGGNDFLRKVDEATTKQNIKATLKITQTAQVDTVLIAQPTLSTAALLTGRLRDHPLYADIAQTMNVPLFADGWSKVLSDKALKSDTIHANNQGYRVFAEKLLAFLAQEGWYRGSF